MPVTIFFNYLNQIYPLKEHLVTYLSEKVTTVEFKKGKYLISPLDKEDCLFFVVKGAVRGFTKINAKKITTWLEVENVLIGRIRSIDGLGITEEYIEAIEDCELVVINKEMLNYLYDNYFEINYIGRVLIERSYAAAEERAFIARLPSAESKYLRFLKAYPHLIERIPLRFIASFLNVSEETLSRVRTKIAKCNRLNL
ncbi:Crp/Fnr family transcriptional regulator [Pedobacter nanyangensis]|uniref:Crp/Fnr family transcriptional regulator n=1 Tax=Pedobacter nanyangensis TaxID=1562389 RepID=UPI000DE4DB78|nr:Crp/Fnr family transcriptional regulator [Pedobacter nanyangensis]